MRIIASSLKRLTALPDGAALPSGTRLLQFLAGAWLWVEAILRWLGPAFALALLYANTALWGWFIKFSPLAQFTVSICFWAAVIFLCAHEFSRVAWPHLTRVKSRLEQAGDLSHQPLQTLTDAPIRRSPLADALWQHHQFRAAQKLVQLRWPKLRAHYALRDPLALRWLLILSALLAALYAPTAAMPRLFAAFLPMDARALSVLGPSEYYLYFTPPSYSGMKPTYISRQTPLPKKLILPMGTEAWLRVAGGTLKPVLKINGEEKKFSRTQDEFFVLQTKLTPGDQLQLRQGVFPLLNLPIEIQLDAPPTVVIQKMTSLPYGKIQVNFCARDNYGIQNITLHWQGKNLPALTGTASIRPNLDKGCADVILDVASEILAGEDVVFWASVENAAGLRQDSEKQNITLPHYDFQNIWAERLAAARQDYVLHGARDVLQQTLAELALSKLPVGLFLSVQNTQQQLAANDHTIDGAILSNLWQITMRMEEGEYADIAANWRAARDELAAGLPNRRISEDNLMKLLARAAENWGDFVPMLGIDPKDYQIYWQVMAIHLSSGERTAAAHTLQLLDENPEQLAKENLTSQVLGNANAASALSNIRTRLMDPELSPMEREYLEKLR